MPEPTPNPNDGGTPAAPAVPETYTFTPPEGAEFSPELVEAYSGIAKKHSMTQEAAQELLNDLHPLIPKPTSAPEAPESYELTPPEGQEFHPEFVNKYAEVAKKYKLSQDAAQGLIAELSPVIQSQQMERIEAVRKEWENASSADKEFGGDKLAENLAVAKKALEIHGTPELSKMLQETGLGNHPEVIRFFVKVGKTLTADSVLTGRRPSGPGASKSFADVANRLYGQS